MTIMMANPAANRPTVCVTTSTVPPASSASSSSDISSAVFLDPATGTILPSLKTGPSVSLNSLARYPPYRLPPGIASCQDVYFAYGTTGGGRGGGGSRGEDNIYLLTRNRDGQQTQTQHGQQSAVSSSSSSNSPPTGIRWKSRPPEPLTTPLTISPCGTYVTAGSKSGTCYVWSALGGDGTLLQTWTAHYRTVNCVVFTDDGGFVVTGGSDGVVNVWSLMELVSCDDGPAGRGRGGDASSSIRPIRTWSEHHLPVTCLHALPSSRLVSTSLDRQLILMEVCSGQTLARILLPSSIGTVTSDQDGRRLFAGGSDGVIYCVDMDSYAVSTTAESSAIVEAAAGGRRNRRGGSGGVMDGLPTLSGSMLSESVLGRQTAGAAAGGGGRAASHVSELRGHEKAVTAIALIDGRSTTGEPDLLISGSEDGSVRVWDLRSRTCARIVRPWSSSASASATQGSGGGKAASAKKAKTAGTVSCPVSSVLIVPRDDCGGCNAGGGGAGTFGPTASASRGGKNADDVSALFRPLQRFAAGDGSTTAATSGVNNGDVVPIVRGVRDLDTLRFWEQGEGADRGDGTGHRGGSTKRMRRTMGGAAAPRSNTSSMAVASPKKGNDGGGDDFLSLDAAAVAVDAAPATEGAKGTGDSSDDDRAEIARLKKELDEARETIGRWEKVNNKLAAKLKKAVAASQG